MRATLQLTEARHGTLCSTSLRGILSATAEAEASATTSYHSATSGRRGGAGRTTTVLHTERKLRLLVK